MIGRMSGSEHDPTVPAGPGYQTSPPLTLQSGTRVGEFELVREIGRGGFGEVWVVNQATPQRQLAMKFIDTRHFGNIPTDRFLREAETLTKLDHPGIAKVITAGTHAIDGRDIPWVCMELIEDAHIFDDGRLHGQTGVHCCIQLTEALTHAHERGVLHLDLKPSNILIDNQHQPHLIDFGAGGMGFNGHRIRSSAGSPRWMAPEQRDPDRTPDARVDVFSVGLVCAVALSNRDVDSIRERGVNASDISGFTRASTLANILNRAIASNPDDRYPNPRLFSEDLHAYQHNQPTTFDRNVVVRFLLWSRRQPVAAALLSAAIILLGLAGMRTAVLRNAVLDASVQASLSAATSAINDGRTADAYRSLEVIPPQYRDVAWELAAGDLQQSTLLRTEAGVGNTEGALMDSDGTIWVWSHGSVYRLANGAVQRILEPGLSYGYARHEERGLLASGAHQGLVIHTDAGEVVFQDINRGGHWWALDFHPDGRSLVGANDWGTVECVDLDQGKVVWSTKVSDAATRDVQFSPSGSHLIVAADDGRVVELDSAGNIQFERKTHDKPIRGVAYSPDGTRYATASSDASCALWNRSDGKPIGRFWSDSAQWDVEWMQPGILATCSTTGSIRIINEEGMRLRKSLQGHTSMVWRLGVSADGRSLVTGSIHNDLRLWSNVIPVDAARNMVAQSQDGQWRILEDPSGGHRLIHEDGRQSSGLWGKTFSFNRPGTHLLASRDDGQHQVLVIDQTDQQQKSDAVNVTTLWSFESPQSTDKLLLSDDAKTAVVEFNSGQVMAYQLGKPPTDLGLPTDPEGQAEPVSSSQSQQLSWSQDGHQLLRTCDRMRGVIIYDLSENTERRVDWTGETTCVCAGLSGDLLCLGGRHGHVQMFNLAQSNQPLWTTLVHGAWCDTLIFEDGFVFTTSADGKLVLLDQKTGNRHATFGPFPTRLQSVQVDAEAVHLVGQDGMSIRMLRKTSLPEPVRN